MSPPTRHAKRPRGPRYIRLVVERLDNGELRISTPEARGAAVTARGPDQLWHRLLYLFNEAAVAGYAMSRGEIYDLDRLTDPKDPTEPPRRRPRTRREVAGDFSEVGYSQDAVVRPDQHNPAEYWPNPDGTWNTPGNRRCADPGRVRSLVFKRAKLGLSTTYDDWLAENGGDAS